MRIGYIYTYWARLSFSNINFLVNFIMTSISGKCGRPKSGIGVFYRHDKDAHKTFCNIEDCTYSLAVSIIQMYILLLGECPYFTVPII